MADMNQNNWDDGLSSSSLSELGSEYDFEPFWLDQTSEDDKAEGNKTENETTTDDDEKTDSTEENIQTPKLEDSIMTDRNMQRNRMESYLNETEAGSDGNQAGLDGNQAGPDNTPSTRPIRRYEILEFNGPPRMINLDLHHHAGRMKVLKFLKYHTNEAHDVIEEEWTRANKEFHLVLYEIERVREMAADLDQKENRFLRRQCALEELIQKYDDDTKDGKKADEELLEYYQKKLKLYEAFKVKETEYFSEARGVVWLIKFYENRGMDWVREIVRLYHGQGEEGLDRIRSRSGGCYELLVELSQRSATLEQAWMDLKKIHFAIHKHRVERDIPLSPCSEYNLKQWADFYRKDFERLEAERARGA
ncbi:hypothetical protein DSL72_003619 [Monilinia vaccinii-corymbosi]|uniref:Uncharacterized protein n=1 Tax=Monilinia vaccinii-corymbosi TaxID=61207 RepID=A0A8A3P846_9HELO|nr:hypothetical protein DSL72_003619 [Monilinia vaccinii-corymbosi]